jgi:hypothetical protein
MVLVTGSTVAAHYIPHTEWGSLQDGRLITANVISNGVDKCLLSSEEFKACADLLKAVEKDVQHVDCVTLHEKRRSGRKLSVLSDSIFCIGNPKNGKRRTDEDANQRATRKLQAKYEGWYDLGQETVSSSQDAQ